MVGAHEEVPFAYQKLGTVKRSALHTFQGLTGGQMCSETTRGHGACRVFLI